MQLIGTWSVERVCDLSEIIVEARNIGADEIEAIGHYCADLRLPIDKKAIKTAISYADAIESYQPKQREANYV